MTRSLDPRTIAVHGPDRVAPPAGHPRGMVEPIYQSVTYDLDAAAYRDIEATGGVNTLWYTRLGNPTITAAAARLAALEGAEHALLTASGMAAITTTMLATIPAGGHVVAARELYGDTLTFLRDELPRHGRRATFVPLGDLAAWERALADDADVLYVETVSNPMLRVADLDALADLARRAGAVAVADATFTPPVGFRTLDHGFDVVLHSATKYLNGHSDVIAGAIAGSCAALAPIAKLAPVLGGSIDPHAAFLVDRGMRTLGLRVDRHRTNARAISVRLASHPEVVAVHHPGLDHHPEHELARTLLPDGVGLVTVQVAGGDARALRFMDALQIVRQATSLGGVESLASAPFNSSHLGLTPDERREAGILDGTVRLSIGVEGVEDLVSDIWRALDRSARAT